MTTPPKPKRPPRLMIVHKAWHVTPNMIRVTLRSDAIKVMDGECAGANCKVFLPTLDQTQADFTQQLNDGPRPVVRTYTVRHIRPEIGEMDIDFVDHGDAGPASAWARQALPGSFCGFAGPGLMKLDTFYADSYLIVADMSALPVAAATLEAMPHDAKGHAIFEVTAAEDRQMINAPPGIKQAWIANKNPNKTTQIVSALVRDLDWLAGRLQTCIAGESGMIKDLRQYLLVERNLPKQDAYISGYWKIGLVEDEHQKVKRADVAV